MQVIDFIHVSQEVIALFSVKCSDGPSANFTEDEKLKVSTGSVLREYIF